MWYSPRRDPHLEASDGRAPRRGQALMHGRDVGRRGGDLPRGGAGPREQRAPGPSSPRQGSGECGTDPPPTPPLSVRMISGPLPTRAPDPVRIISGPSRRSGVGTPDLGEVISRPSRRGGSVVRFSPKGPWASPFSGRQEPPRWRSNLLMCPVTPKDLLHKLPLASNGIYLRWFLLSQL